MEPETKNKGGVLEEKRLARLTPCKFTPGDLKAMDDLLDKNRLIPPGGSTHLRDHVEHCLWQMVRFATLASSGKKFRALQFGLNLGRAQELLGSYGGVEAWWRTFKPLVESENWVTIQDTVRAYLDLLRLARPTTKFVTRE